MVQSFENTDPQDREVLREAPKVMWHGRVFGSPFLQKTLEAGAKAFSVYNHMWLPSFYTDPDDEYQALVTNVTLWDVAVERVVEITGPDALEFTNMLTPRDLTKCRVGQCKYVVIVDKKGRVHNDPVLSRLGENHFWLAAADSDLLLWATFLADMSELNVEVTEPDASALQVQGPKSLPLMCDLFGKELINGIKYYHCIETSLDDIPVLVARTGYTAEMGYEIYLRDWSRGGDLWDKIMKAGADHEIQPIGPCNARRIEAGMLSLGACDMKPLEHNPYELYEDAMLKWLVELGQSADFIGKDALTRIHDEGVAQKLVGVKIPGDRLMSAQSAFEKTRWDINVDGKRVGDLRSMAWSPGLGVTIGYAMVPKELSKPGTSLFVVLPSGEKRFAVVAKKPFINHKTTKAA